eukprot:m.276649 g.276649  ORF g.276649 m.276649 type:complete len:1904 (-) comp22866_c0_seq11:52-5763(-)
MADELKSKLTSLFRDAKAAIERGPARLHEGASALEQVGEVLSALRAIPGADLTSFEAEHATLQTQLTHGQLDKELSDIVYNLRSKLNDAESTFKRGPPKSWFTDGMDKLEEAEAIAETVRDAKFAVLPKQQEVLADFEKRRDVLKESFRVKMLECDVNDVAYDIRNKLNDAEDKVRRAPPVSWLDDGLAALETAEQDLVPRLRDPKYAEVPKAQEVLADFEKRAAAVRQTATTKRLDREMYEAVQDVRNKLNSAEDKFKKGPPKAWWDEAMEELEKAEELMADVRDSKFKGMAKQVECIEDFNARRIQLRISYAESTVADALRDAIYNNKSKLNEAEDKMKKGPPVEWFHEAMASLEQAEELSKVLLEPRFAHLPEQKAAIESHNARRDQLRKDFQEKVLGNELDDLCRELGSVLAESERLHAKGPPRQFWDESMAALAKAEPLAQQIAAAKFTGLPRVESTLGDYQQRKATLQQSFKDKTLADDLDNAVRDVKFKLGSAEDKLKKCPPVSWAMEAMAALEEADKLMLAVLEPRYMALDARTAFVNEYEQRKEALRTTFCDKVLVSELDQVVYDLTSKLSAAEEKFKKGPPKSFWDEAMQLLEECEEPAKQLAQPKYAAMSKQRIVLDDYAARAGVLRKSYGDKVLKDELGDILRELRGKLSSAEGMLARGPPRSYYDDAMAELEKAEAVLSAAKAAKFSDMEDLKTALDEFGTRRAALRAGYREKAIQADLDEAVYEMRFALSSAETTFAKQPPVSWAYDAMEMLEKAEEKAQVVRDVKFMGMTQQEAALKDFDDRKAKLRSSFQTAVLDGEVDALVQDVNFKLGAAKDLFAKGPPVGWWEESMTKLEEADEACKPLRDDKYKGMAKVESVVQKFDADATALRRDYATRVHKDALERAVAELQSKMSTASDLMKKGPPRFWCDKAMEELDVAEKSLLPVVQEARFAAMPEAQAAVAAFNEQKTQLRRDYQDKALKEDVSELTYTLTSGMNDAKRLFDKGPSFWEDAMAALERCGPTADSLKDDKFQGMEAASKAVADFETAKVALQKQYLEAVFGRELETNINEIRSLLSQAETTFAKGPPVDFWEDALMLADDARAKMQTFMGKYGHVSAVTAVSSELEDRVGKLRAQYVEKTGRKLADEPEEEAAAASGGGKGAQKSKTGFDVLTDYVYGDSGFTLPQMPIVEINFDIKAKLFKQFRQYNDQAKSLNTAMKEAATCVNAMPFSQAGKTKSNLEIWNIQTAQYPINSVNDFLARMRTDGPQRTISDLLSEEPDYPPVLALRDAHDAFSAQWKALTESWRKLEKLSLRIGELRLCTVYLAKFFEECDFSSGTFPCGGIRRKGLLREPRVLSGPDSFSDSEALLYIAQKCKDVIFDAGELERENPGLPGDVTAPVVKAMTELRAKVLEYHAKHCLRMLAATEDANARMVYLKALTKFPLALAEAPRIMLEQSNKRYERREHEQPENKNMPKEIPAAARDSFEEESADWYKPKSAAVKPGPASVSGLPYAKRKPMQNKEVLEACKPYTGKLVFSADAVPKVPTADFASRLSTTFAFGQPIHARAFWEQPIRNFAVAVSNDDKKTPVYGPETLTYTISRGKHYLELLLFVSINGKQVHRRGQPDGAFAWFEERGTDTHSRGQKGADFWGSNQSCRVPVFKTSCENLSDFGDDWEQAAPRLAYHLTQAGAGTHEVKVDLCFRLAQGEENMAAFSPVEPRFDSLVSHPIASGSFKITVPAGAKVPNPLPVRSTGLPADKAAQYEQCVKEWLQKARDWGARGNKTEVPIGVILRGDMRVVSTQTVRVTVSGSNSVTFEEEPTQYGVNVYAVFYRSPESGWSREEVIIFDLTACAQVYAGASKGQPPVADIPPVTGVMVGSNGSIDAHLVPDELFAGVPRCLPKLAWLQ